MNSATQPWYEMAFAKSYLQLYAHRNQAEARQAIDLFLKNCQPDPQQLILDSACGHGRHLQALRNKGLKAFGFDLSWDLLQASPIKAPRADMRRLPFRSHSCGAVTSFFTSLGYFEDDQDNAQVLAEWSRVMKSGGQLFLDTINPGYVKANLVPQSEKEEQGVLICEERRIDESSQRVIKQVSLTFENGESQNYFESVRLFEIKELTSMLEKVGLQISGKAGHYDGRSYDESSPRMILWAKKT